VNNLLLQPVDWKVDEGAYFVVKRYLSPATGSYTEYTSHLRMGQLPLVHITLGRNPETGQRTVARGVIAIGRFAVGIVALGQVAVGAVAIGQASFGGLALGQLAISATLALGQLSVAPFFALGQISVAHTAIGQIAVGEYAMGQQTYGVHEWTPTQKDPLAEAHFRQLGIP
jgi:hypothetical protein